MQEMILTIMGSSTALKAGAWLGLPLSVALIVLFAVRQNRDERGWKIFGKASVITLLVFLVLANLIAQVVGDFSFPKAGLDYIFYANTIQWLYNIVILTELVSVAVLKKLE